MSDGVGGKSSLIVDLLHIWESIPWAPRIGPVGIEAVENPHCPLNHVPGSLQERCSTLPIHFVGIDVVPLWWHPCDTLVPIRCSPPVWCSAKVGVGYVGIDIVMS